MQKIHNGEMNWAISQFKTRKPQIYIHMAWLVHKIPTSYICIMYCIDVIIVLLVGHGFVVVLVCWWWAYILS